MSVKLVIVIFIIQMIVGGVVSYRIVDSSIEESDRVTFYKGETKRLIRLFAKISILFTITSSLFILFLIYLVDQLPK